MEVRKLLEEEDRWYRSINASTDKNIDRSILRELSKREIQLTIVEMIVTGVYRFEQPSIGFIPKDDGTYRQVFVNTDIDRVVLNLISSVLEDVYGDQLSPYVYSYRKNMSVGLVLNKVIVECTGNWEGVKVDLKKYFDSVNRSMLEKTIDQCSLGDGIDKCIKYYCFEDLEDGTYKSLGQGSALSAFYSNWVLRDVDNRIVEKFGVKYYRYADDILIVGENWKVALNWLKSEIGKLGLHLNNKKTEEVNSRTRFKYLGYYLENGVISPSKKAYRLVSEIVKKSGIQQSSTTSVRSAIRKVNKQLYGKHGVLKGVLGVVNTKEGLQSLDLYCKDCIRRAYTGKNNEYRNNRVLPNELLQNLGYLSMQRLYDCNKVNSSTLEVLVKEYKNPKWTTDWISTSKKQYCINELQELVKLGHSIKFYLEDRIILVDNKRYDYSNRDLLPSISANPVEILCELYDTYYESYGKKVESNFPSLEYWELSDSAIVLEEKALNDVRFEAFLVFGSVLNLFKLDWKKDFIKILNTKKGNKLILKREWFIKGESDD